MVCPVNWFRKKKLYILIQLSNAKPTLKVIIIKLMSMSIFYFFIIFFIRTEWNIDFNGKFLQKELSKAFFYKKKELHWVKCCKYPITSNLIKLSVSKPMNHVSYSPWTLTVLNLIKIGLKCNSRELNILILYWTIHTYKRDITLIL